jgi:NADH-quinone oxidoreductase subunit F
LINYYIDPTKCQACQLCLRECPVGAIKGNKDQVHWIEQEKCIKCGICQEICNFNAIKKISKEFISKNPLKGMKPILRMEN